MAVLSLTDFSSGEFAIATDKNTSLSSYITDDAIKPFLYELFGKELADEYLADPSASIFDPINTTNYFNYLISKGVKYYLQGCVFDKYTNDTSIRNLTTGNAQINNEGSTPIGVKATILYNRSVSTAHAIQYYCQSNYSNYDGKYICFGGI